MTHAAREKPNRLAPLLPVWSTAARNAHAFVPNRDHPYIVVLALEP